MPRPRGAGRVNRTAPRPEPAAARGIRPRDPEAAQRDAAVQREAVVGRGARGRARVCRRAATTARAHEVKRRRLTPRSGDPRLSVNGMTNRAAKACVLSFAALILAAAACGARQPSAERAAVMYPEPRFPSYLKPPASVEEVLPHVRPLARNKIGFQGSGLGIAQQEIGRASCR